ncbi:ATP-dependent DNA helicase, partial [Streptomyces sp. SID5998]|nr:ATP-dependent DNA helicase [Streptomyces sp. SID5998]
ETALRRRREAAATVRAHLDALTARAEDAPQAALTTYDDPDWPPPPEDDEPPYDEPAYDEPLYAPPYDEDAPLDGEDPGDWDDWSGDRPAIPHQTPPPDESEPPAVGRPAHRQQRAGPAHGA